MLRLNRCRERKATCVPALLAGLPGTCEHGFCDAKDLKGVSERTLH